MNYAWLGEVVFGISYFVAWCLGAFKMPGSHANLFVTISAIAALVFALALLFDNRSVFNRNNTNV